MKKRCLLRMLPLLAALAIVNFGCSKDMSKTATTNTPAAGVEQKKNETVYKGPIIGRSNKAKTISITVGKGDQAKTMMVRFDDNTKGLEYALKGEAAIINWEQRGSEKFATVIKPKLAKLPEGVTEIKVDELHNLLDAHVPLTLVDARPKLRYDQGHLPGAISIPVPKLKEMQEKVLPTDKDKLLVFYCGGYT